MPIKPENLARYPKDWKQIRARILDRAWNRCEQCGVANYATGFRNDDGEFVAAVSAGHCTGFRWFKIVLTIAHLNHTPENCADENLKALCQRCHLAYDHEHHQRNARNTRKDRKALADLFAK